MWRIGTGLLLLMITNHCMGQGELLPEERIASRYLKTNRTVRVWLPASYDLEPKRRYPVLYVHDGQNVFSSAGPNACFGWGGWELDKIVERLCASNQMREIIMVAIDNSRFRYQEYRGPAGRASAAQRSDPDRFRNYAAFLAKELKPKIDRDYRTLKAPAHTAVMGSSLGGICSLAIAWEYPRVFGAAASLSGSFQIEKRQFLETVLQPYRRQPKPFRIYLDSGRIDYTGDDDGRANTTAVALELRRIGWKEGKNLMHYVQEEVLTEPDLERAGVRRDKWAEAQHSQHNELYWRLRVWRPLTFLFPPKK